jgi:NADPH:quinone reductase-like Zn-dependent oxidoreductase
VIGAAGSGKQDAVLALGADQAIDYDAPGWESQLPDATVILEMSGGKVFRAAVRHVAPMGRIVVVGASAAIPLSRNPLARLRSLRDMPRAGIFDMLRRSYGLMSFHIGWLLESGLLERQWSDLVHFTEEHRITPVVGQQFEFAEIADAHRALESRKNIGKVVVRMA